MEKVAILVPYQEMRALASPLVSSYANRFEVMCLEYVRTEAAAARARELEAQGCDLIVARGVQAQFIRRSVRIPVVEIRVTTQEMGAVVLELKEELRKTRPRIALIGFSNMFGDTSQYDTLFGVELKKHMVRDSSELTMAAELAIREGCDGVIGGDIVCEYARRVKFPCRYIPTGQESIAEAMAVAERVCYAMSLEKRNSAEINTMLDNTFNGIMQVDDDGRILRANRVCCDILGMRQSDLIGKILVEVLPKLDPRFVDDALLRGKEGYASVMDINHRAVIINLAPIQLEGGPDGAVLTLQESKRIIEMDSELRRELYQRGFIARYTFDKLPGAGQEEGKIIRMARRISRYPAPVLITGESGTGKDMIAQCIHNESLFRNNAFVPLDCSAWLPETLDNMLFGNYTTRKDSEACMAELAQEGTLYISNVDKLPFETQYKLVNLIRGKFMHNGSNRPSSTNVRVIASCSKDLVAKVERGEFRRDLYYALSVLSLEMPPVRENKEQMMRYLDRCLQEWQDKYKRYVHLTGGARKFLEEYDWPGNLDQIDSVCERIVLLTEKRNVDEGFIRRQLEQVTPRILPGTEKVVLYKDQKAVEIAALLRKHGGNREKVAAELGVSKTTLWRYIKKYGIEPDFNY